MFKTIATMVIYAVVCDALYTQHRAPKVPQATSSSYQETPYAVSAHRSSSPYRVSPSGQYEDTVDAAEEVKPIPYTFGYDTSDEYGTKVTRAESSDGKGAIKGSYSYIDPAGVTRTVEYIADDNGFRATIKTNEPGTQQSSPASTLINSNPLQVVAIQSAEPSPGGYGLSSGKAEAQVAPRPTYKLVAPARDNTQPEYTYAAAQAERPQPSYRLVAPAQAAQPEYAQQDYSYSTAPKSVPQTDYSYSVARQVAPQSSYAYDTPTREVSNPSQTSYASSSSQTGQQYGYKFSVPAYDSPTPAPQTAFKVDASQTEVATAQQNYFDSLPDAVKQLLSQRYATQAYQ